MSVLPTALIQRWRAWWLARLPHTDVLTLTQRNVYILPTRAGWMLALTLLVLLLASINFQINLGYLLTFLLAGSAVAGMYVSHATLRGLTLRLLPPEPQFLGAPVLLRVQLHNACGSARHAIGLAIHSVHSVHSVHSGKATPYAHTDVPANGSANIAIAFQPTRRGLHPLPTLTAHTLYPLGTFRVWTLWQPTSQVLVYPRPEVPTPPLPAGQPRAGSGSAVALRSAGEFDGVRAYQRGDPMKLIVWKKAAQALATGTGELVSRAAGQSAQHELWLDFAATHLPDKEARLARLTAWVLHADRLNLAYGLRLPGKTITPDSGPSHCQRCLQALALEK